MALTIAEDILIGFGSAIGAFIILWIFQNYTFSNATQQMAQTTITAVQAIQNTTTTAVNSMQSSFAEYTNALLLMHGANNLVSHANENIKKDQSQAK